MIRLCRSISILWLSFAAISCSKNTTQVDSVHTWSFKPSDVTISVLTKEFDGIDSLAQINKENLIVATNGGIFGKDHKPLGLLFDKKLIYPINLKDGDGNFYLQPNGVFYIHDSVARVLETKEFDDSVKHYDLAIQSGPLLLDRGTIHPHFKSNSKSKYTRNGIGVSSDGVVHMAFFSEPCNLHAMASYFKNELGCQSALYLDGAISGMISKQLAIRPNQKFGSIIVVRSKLAHH